MSDRQKFDWIITIKAEDKVTILALVPFYGTERQCFSFGVKLSLLNPGKWIGKEKRG